MYRPPGKRSHPLHLALHHSGKRIVIWIAGLAILEIDIGILSRAAYIGMLGVHGTLTEFQYLLTVNQRENLFVWEHADCRHLIGGAETVEAMQHRHAAVDSSEMRHNGKVVGFLHGGRHKHSEACGTRSHDVGMVAEY
jgi:hypothetical protein